MFTYNLSMLFSAICYIYVNSLLYINCISLIYSGLVIPCANTTVLLLSFLHNKSILLLLFGVN